MLYNLKNERLSLSLKIENGIFVEECTPSAANFQVTYGKLGEVFTLTCDDKVYHSSEFPVIDIQRCSDATEELLTVLTYSEILGISVRICVLSDSKNKISLSLQMSDNTPPELQKNYTLHSPFLANLHIISQDKDRLYFPKNPAPKSNGESVMQLNNMVRLPLVVTDIDDKAGLSVSFPTLSFMTGANQTRNMFLGWLSDINELKTHSLQLRLNRYIADILEFCISGLENGWREAFAEIRKEFLASIDLREYKRDDLKWFRDTVLHHFAFVYSKEVYDYENERVDMERLLQVGEEFGGYDTITLWHQYPQLGVDKRNQWDFFRDFPGSYEGLSKAAQTLHSKGVRMFLPFKPWDIGSNQTADDVSENIADILRKTNADGLFLDTMNEAPEHFRRAADKVKPGILFLAEMQPDKHQTLEILTASWDQYRYENTLVMPEINLLRFLIPEHASPQVSRWQNGEWKDDMIKRAIFSGTGLVIWQDIFGTWLPYSKTQKETIKNYKTMWLKYRRYFQSAEPIPLYPVEINGLYCNQFPSPDGAGCVYTLYNSLDAEIDGTLIRHRGDFYAEKCLPIWGDAQMKLSGQNILGTIKGKQVLAIEVK